MMLCSSSSDSGASPPPVGRAAVFCFFRRGSLEPWPSLVGQGVLVLPTVWPPGIRPVGHHCRPQDMTLVCTRRGREYKGINVIETTRSRDVSALTHWRAPGPINHSDFRFPPGFVTSASFHETLSRIASS